MMAPQITWLTGNRLHLNHGPIDLVIWAEGRNADQAFAKAVARFENVLLELVAELPELRSATPNILYGSIARKMARAVEPYKPAFITPMAAVAGAVADAVLWAMIDGTDLTRAYVNNGGDIALHLDRGHSLTSAIVHSGRFRDRVTLHFDDPARGIATSGWRGRSHSLGIADAVTVVARTAADADAAATMIANAVDLPGHPSVERRPANAIQTDSDLGAIPVTVDVAPLAKGDIDIALKNGAALAAELLNRGIIAGSALFLQSHSRSLGCLTDKKEFALA